MALLHFDQCSPADIAQLNRAKTVVLLSVGPLENHGPHLPFATDPIQSAHWADQLAQRLQMSRPDWNFLIYPDVLLGSHTAHHVGTVEIEPIVLRQVLYAHLKQMAKDGFKNIIAITAHAGPRHIVVLEELAERMRWRHRVRMISAASRIIVEVLRGQFVDEIDARLKKRGDQLSETERKGLRRDYHGGMLETSFMLHFRPELVRPIYKTLQPSILDKMWKFTSKSAQKVPPGLGYLGSPALARAEIGHAAFEVIMDKVLPLIERFVDGHDVRKDFRSKFYYIPIFRTDFKWAIYLIVYGILFGGAWLFLLKLMTEVS